MALELVEIKDILPYSEPVDRMAEREKHLADEMEESFNNAVTRWKKQVIKPQKEIIRNAIMDAQGDGENVTVDGILNELETFDSKIQNVITNAYTTFNQDEADMIQRELNIRDMEYFKKHGHWPKATRDVMKGVSLLELEDDESNSIGETKSVNVSDLFTLDDEDTTPPVSDRSSNIKETKDNDKDVGGIVITPDMLL